MFGHRMQRSLLSLVGTLALGAMIAAPVSAAVDSNASVTQQITSGSFTAAIDGGSMNSIPYSNDPQVTSGTVHLNVNDATGTGQGWNVLVSSSAFLYGGSSVIGQDIPAANFYVAATYDPTLISGQPVDSTHGPVKVGGSLGDTLNSPRKVISAESGFGSGNYAETIDLKLNVPAQSQAGTYTATLTVSLNTGP